MPCPLPRRIETGACVDCFPIPRGLPQTLGGSASALSFSRPAQASLALRPARLLNRPRRPLSRGFDGASCPATPPVSYQRNRQLAGWNPPPQVFRTFEAHQRKPTSPAALLLRGVLVRAKGHTNSASGHTENQLTERARLANYMAHRAGQETYRRADYDCGHSGRQLGLGAARKAACNSRGIRNVGWGGRGMTARTLGPRAAMMLAVAVALFAFGVAEHGPRTGRKLRSFRRSGTLNGSSRVAFSPDGKQVLSGSFDNTAKLWDAATGASYASSRGTARPVVSVASRPTASGHPNQDDRVRVGRVVEPRRSQRPGQRHSLDTSSRAGPTRSSAVVAGTQISSDSVPHVRRYRFQIRPSGSCRTRPRSTTPASALSFAAWTHARRPVTAAAIAAG